MYKCTALGQAIEKASTTRMSGMVNSAGHHDSQKRYLETSLTYKQAEYLGIHKVFWL
jgi:hypothetical protein